MAGLCLGGCGTAGFKHKDLVSQPSMRGSRVLVVAPQFHVFEIGVGQEKVRRSDMEEDVIRKITEAASEFSKEKGWFVPVSVPSLAEAQQYELSQRMSLLWANQQMYSAIKEKRGTAVAQIEDHFSGTIGQSEMLASLADQTGAQYLLLIAGYDSYTTGAAKLVALASVVATLGHSPLQLNGTGEMSVCLVELKTGKIAWIASETSKRDLTDQDNHKRMLKTLLQRSPLGEN